MKKIMFSNNVVKHLEEIQKNEAKKILKIINSGVLETESKKKRIKNSDGLFLYRINSSNDIVYSIDNDNIIVIDIENKKELFSKNKEEYEKILSAIIEQTDEQDSMKQGHDKLLRLMLLSIFMTIIFSFTSMFLQNSLFSRYINIGLIISCSISMVALLVYWKKK